jgi:hypothetical protein
VERRVPGRPVPSPQAPPDPALPPPPATPPKKQVYTFFLALYKVAWTLGVAGYVLLILDLFGVGLLLTMIGLPPGTSLILLWYG